MYTKLLQLRQTTALFLSFSLFLRIFLLFLTRLAHTEGEKLDRPTNGVEYRASEKESTFKKCIFRSEKAKRFL